MKGNGARLASRRRRLPGGQCALTAEWCNAGANCLRIVPNSAVKFLTYEHVSRCAVAVYCAAQGNLGG